jgi:hypothetical protein
LSPPEGAKRLRLIFYSEIPWGYIGFGQWRANALAVKMLHHCANRIKFFVSRALRVSVPSFPQTFEHIC